MRKYRFALITIFIFLCGCSPVIPVRQTTMPVENGAIARKPTSSSEPYSVRTATILIPTFETNIIPTFIPTTTQTSPFQQLVIRDSISICSSDNSNKSTEVSGTLIYQGYGDQGLYAVDGNKLHIKNQITFNMEQIFVFGVSPNGNWIAYSPEPKDKNHQLEKMDPTIVLIGENGKKIESTLDVTWLRRTDEEYYELENFVDGHWLNDHLIFAYVKSKIPENNPGSGISPQIGRYLPILFDPFTGEVQTTLLNVFMPTNGRTAYSISPDLKRILVYDYISRQISLKDVSETASIITRWKSGFGLWNAFIPIRWSPNAEWAIFSLYTDRYTSPIQSGALSRDGKGLIFENSSFKDRVIKYSAWSSDSRNFAFVLSKTETLYDLYVFDVTDKTLVLVCPIVTKHLYPPENFAWSPDNAWIAVSTYEEPIRLINIRTGQSKELDLVGNVVGWLDKFSVTP